jgi:hypothetical protein
LGQEDKPASPYDSAVAPSVFVAPFLTAKYRAFVAVND